MPQANLNTSATTFSDGKAAIVVVQLLADIPGGRTLNVEGYSEKTVKVGHVIKKMANGDLAPVNVSGDAYVALAEGESYVGIGMNDITVNDARESILTMGQVREAALPYPVTAEIKAALPNIQFI